MTGSINVSGTWKSVSDISVNVGGTWKTVTDGYVNVSGTWKPFYASVVSNPPTSIEYLVVSGGANGSNTGGRGGYYSTGSFSVSLGTSQTVTIGAGGGGNSSMTSVSAPTNYNGVSRSNGSTQGTYVSTIMGGCVQVYRNIEGYGGGAGGASNGSSGFYSIGYSTINWGGGSGGSAATTLATTHSKGGNGYYNPGGTFSAYNNCGGYYMYFSPNGNFQGSGSANTGDGGGGYFYSGGSGVVKIRYPDTYDNLTSSTGTLAVTGGYKYYTFNSTGSFTV